MQTKLIGRSAIGRFAHHIAFDLRYLKHGKMRSLLFSVLFVVDNRLRHAVILIELVDGTKLFIHVSDKGPLRNIFQDGLYSHFPVRKEWIVLDVGAHVGIFTLFVASRLRGTGTVLAIEPCPQNYELLARNILTDKYRNVIAFREALSDNVGSTKLFLSTDSASHSIVGDGKASINVDTETIDNIVSRMNLPRIDLLKINAEGAELSILQGAERSMHRITHAIIEVHPCRVIGKDVESFLAERGFKLRRRMGSSPFYYYLYASRTH